MNGLKMFGFCGLRAQGHRVIAESVSDLSTELAGSPSSWHDVVGRNRDDTLAGPRGQGRVYFSHKRPSLSPPVRPLRPVTPSLRLVSGTVVRVRRPSAARLLPAPGPPARLPACLSAHFVLPPARDPPFAHPPARLAREASGPSKTFKKEMKHQRVLWSCYTTTLLLKLVVAL